MDQLYLELKQLIIDSLMLPDVRTEDISTDGPLFDGGLGLDSIDALELGLAVKHKFGIKLSADNEVMRRAFYSVHCLADFIAAQRGLRQPACAAF